MDLEHGASTATSDDDMDSRTTMGENESVYSREDDHGEEDVSVTIKAHLDTNTGMFCFPFESYSSFSSFVISQCQQIVKRCHAIPTSSFSPEIFLPLRCWNMDQTFLCHCVIIEYLFEENQFQVSMDYHVAKASRHRIRNISISRVPYQDIPRLVFCILTRWCICKECIRPTCHSSGLCRYCIFYKIRNDFMEQEEKGKTSSVGIPPQKTVPQCPICLEDTYHFELHCHHKVHKECILRLNPFPYFSKRVRRRCDLRCPLCRQPFSPSDIESIFF